MSEPTLADLPPDIQRAASIIRGRHVVRDATTSLRRSSPWSCSEGCGMVAGDDYAARDHVRETGHAVEATYRIRVVGGTRQKPSV
jgi:hypothetical protein